jgi:hypothetical protein
MEPTQVDIVRELMEIQVITKELRSGEPPMEAPTVATGKSSNLSRSIVNPQGKRSRRCTDLWGRQLMKELVNKSP